MQGHTDHIGGLAFCADGTSIATACEDRVVRLFKLTDVAAKNLAFMKHNMTSTPVDVAFGSASNLLAVTTKGDTQPACVFVCLSTYMTGFVTKGPVRLFGSCLHLIRSVMFHCTLHCVLQCGVHRFVELCVHLRHAIGRQCRPRQLHVVSLSCCSWDLPCAAKIQL